MSKSLFNMVGSKILNLSGIDDYWLISTDEFIVTIYNPIMIGGSNNELISISQTIANAIAGSIITKVVFQEEEQLMIEVDNNKKLFILLRNENYSGPEALCLNYRSGEIIVVQ